MNKSKKPVSLNLELETVESRCKPGCGSSTTLPLCTCPISC